MEILEKKSVVPANWMNEGDIAIALESGTTADIDIVGKLVTRVTSFVNGVSKQDWIVIGGKCTDHYSHRDDSTAPTFMVEILEKGTQITLKI